MADLHRQVDVIDDAGAFCLALFSATALLRECNCTLRRESDLDTTNKAAAPASVHLRAIERENALRILPQLRR
jgi:hypothetical protein